MASACSRCRSAATVHTRGSAGPARPRSRVAARRSSTDSRTDSTTNKPAKTTSTDPSTGQNTTLTTPYAIEITGFGPAPAEAHFSGARLLRPRDGLLLLAATLA